MTIYEVAGAIALLAAAPANLLALVYGVGSPWYRSTLGTVIFLKWLSVALVFDYIVLRRITGDFPMHDWVALVLYAFVFLTFTATLAEVIIERRAPARTKEGVTMTHVNSGAGTTQRFTAAKAIVGAVATGVVAGLGAAATGLADGALSPLEWVLIASAAIVGTGITGTAVYYTENKPKPLD